MLNSLYLSSRCRNCCCVATSCELTRSICCVGIFSSRLAVGFRGAGAFRRMLSNASLLFARKSGCLNSQAFNHLSALQLLSGSSTNSRSVWRSTTLFVVVPNFVEIILVELAHKTCEVTVLEVLWQYRFGKFLVLSGLSALR